jgi:hypothetical protein
MKTVVSVQEVEEFALKPRNELAQWRSLLEEHLRVVATSAEDTPGVPCPSCGMGGAREAFQRLGIPYAECVTCGTLFARKRLSEATLRDWYRDSPPARYWREVLLPASASARLEQVVAPRAQWVADGIAEYLPGATVLLDVSANAGAFLNALSQMAPDLSMIAAGVAADLEGLDAAVHVSPSSVERLVDLAPADMVTAIDAFDRAADLRALVSALRGTLRPQGLVFATLPVASGFEIQTLWEHSPTVLPPDKLNLPTVEGLRRLFPASEWELLELSTPGMFDVDVVKRVMALSPEVSWPRAVRALVQDLDSTGHITFTEFLQSERRTSFARLVARRIA